MRRKKGRFQLQQEGWAARFDAKGKGDWGKEKDMHNNMIHNRIHENGLLAATVPSSAWPLILKEFSDMPDVLYYLLLQQKNGAMIGHSCHGCCERKQDLVD
jgi:predicted Rossmann fold nucleotide-binding protein DprA/Smf involved in DNA uptake